MRTAMVTGDDLTHYRGGTIHLMEQAENLLRLGHEVTVFAQGRGAYPLPTQVPIRYLPAPGRGSVRLLIYNLGLFVGLLLHSLRHRPDVIHTRQMGYSATPLLVARLLRIPHVLEVNGVLRDELGADRASRGRLALIDVFARLNLHLSNAFSTTTAEHLDRLQALYGLDRSRATVIPCGVNVDRFAPGDGEPLRQELGISPDTFVLIHVGSLYAWRGLDLLLEGLALLGNGIPDWQLMLVGEGAEVPRLMEQSRRLGMETRVRFVGQVPYADIPDYLRAADVGVVFYKKTRSLPGDPMKIYEYMACSLPVLAGDYPNYGGIVLREEAGVAVDETDPRAIADALMHLHDTPQDRLQYGRNGVRAAAREYSWLARTRILEAVLARAAGPREEPG